MSQTIYEKLRKQIDQYSVGFPKTESGVEIKLLKKLYTEEEAALYLDLKYRSLHRMRTVRNNLPGRSAISGRETC